MHDTLTAIDNGALPASALANATRHAVYGPEDDDGLSPIVFNSGGHFDLLYSAPAGLTEHGWTHDIEEALEWANQNV